MAKVSVILPIYNVEKYLGIALDSLINQTLKDIEIICVNDCSTDSCKMILEDYSQKDDRIKVINLETNGGQGNARNIAIDMVQSEYIMFLDPDDWLELDACETAYNRISKNKNDFVMFGFNKYYQKNKKTKEQKYWYKPFEGHLDEDNIKLNELSTNYMQNAFSVCRIYNRDFLNKYNIRYSDDRIDQDNIFVVNAFISADNISVITKPLYNYRIHNESVSFNTKRWKGMIDSRRRSYELIKERNVDIKYMKMFLNYCIPALILWYQKFSKLDADIKENLYEEIRSFFKQIEQEQSFLNESNLLSYDTFKVFIEKDYNKYELENEKSLLKSLLCNLQKIIKKIFKK